VRAGSSVVAVLLASALAHAQPSTTATATVEFDRGRALLKERRYVEACAAFEHSLALDPQNGTRYNLAICDEKLGGPSLVRRSIRSHTEMVLLS